MKILLRVMIAIALLSCLATTARAGEVELNSTQSVDANTWKQKDVVIKSPTGDVTITVTDGMTGYSPSDPTSYADDLTIETTHPNDANLVFKNPGNNAPLVFSGDMKLTGHRDPSYVPGAPNPDNYTGWATVSIGEDARVIVGGKVDLNDYSKIDISSSGTGSANLYTWGLNIAGKESTVTIGANGNLTVGNSLDTTDSKTRITEGSLRLTSNGKATFYGTVSVSGEDASLVLSGQSTINMEQSTVSRDQTIILTDKGQLIADGSATAADIHGNVDNQTGSMQVDGNLTVSGEVATSSSEGTVVNGSLTAGSLRVYTRNLGSGQTTTGKVTVAAGGLLTTDSVTVESGTLDIQGDLSHVSSGSSLLTLTGGTVTVGASSTVTMDGITASAGSFSAAAGSDLQVDSLRFSGSVSATISGKVKAGAGISVSGGTLNLNSVADDIGDGTGLDTLSSSGSGIINLSSTFTTDNMSIGGTLNMNSGLLTVNNATTVTGTVSMNGGSFDFKGNVSLGSSGSLIMNTASASIEMNNNTLTIGAGGTLDTQAGSLTLTNSGGVNLNGTYIVGHDGTDTTMLISEGGGALSIGANASVQMNTDARRAFTQTINPKGMLILDTDGMGAAGTTLFWNSGSTVYYYEVLETSTGEWGLYVTGSRTLTRQEQYANILGAWRGNDRVGSNVGNVLNQSLLDAIVDSAALVEGSVPGYDNLSNSGKFNAEALTSLVNPKHSGAGYDSLMLYNGSGITMASEAIISSNARLMRRVGDRNNIVRREVIREQAEDPEGYADYEPCDLPPDMARVWAEVLYHSDSAGHRDGFAGYKYRGTGLMLGADKRKGEVWFGGSLTYLGGSFDDSSALDSDSDIDTYAAILYAGYQHDSGTYFNASLGYGYSDNALDDLRVLNGYAGRNRASYASHSVMANLAVGKDFPVGEYLTLTPSTGIRYIHTRNNGHTQTFSSSGFRGAETLHADAISAHSAAVPVDLAISYDVIGGDQETAFSITGKVGYEYEMSNKGAKGNIRYVGLSGIGPVRAASRAPGRHTLNLGVSTRYLYKNYEFGFAYDYSNRDKYNSHALTASAGMIF